MSIVDTARIHQRLDELVDKMAVMHGDVRSMKTSLDHHIRDDDEAHADAKTLTARVGVLEAKENQRTGQQTLAVGIVRSPLTAWVLAVGTMVAAYLKGGTS